MNDTSPPEQEAKGWLNKLKQGLSKSRKSLTQQLESVARRFSSLEDGFWQEIEEVLISSDVGIDTSLKIVEDLRKEAQKKKANDPKQVFPLLERRLAEILQSQKEPLFLSGSEGFDVVLVVGVNGTGKTTTIAKIACKAKEQGKKVLLAAADTFRAAAIEQLEVWAKKTGTEVVKHERGSDAAAVVYDAIRASKARGVDLLLVDTAGRLHTQVNLMEELKKIKRVAVREAEEVNLQTGEARVCTLLILDATTGQNALSQMKLFDEALDVDGVVLTKMDGTAKGGIIVAIKNQFGVPIWMIGIGEQIDSLVDFDAQRFSQALVGD